MEILFAILTILLAVPSLIEGSSLLRRNVQTFAEGKRFFAMAGLTIVFGILSLVLM